MKTDILPINIFCVISLCFFWIFGSHLNGQAIEQVKFEFEHFAPGDLDWVDSADDNNTDSISLDFTVILDNTTYSHFDMDSNGYVELLIDANDIPTNYGFGNIDNLIGSDPDSTYLLAAYDDLNSSSYGYYGYKLYSDRAVFYYDTETYNDDDDDKLNNFQIILYQDGTVQWNFNRTQYSSYSNDLFSGLYLGSTQTLLTVDRGYIPRRESYGFGHGCSLDLYADINGDCFVNLVDLSMFLAQWLQCGDIGDLNCQI